MKYQPLSSSLYIKNREKFCYKLTESSVAIFNSNDIMPTNADGTMRFRQNNDLFYLTGIDQEESILVLFPDFDNDSWREILFVTETNEHIAVWEGHKYTKEEAQDFFDKIMIKDKSLKFYESGHFLPDEFISDAVKGILNRE
jgi:Xaa-Pro aminopeptidase